MTELILAKPHIICDYKENITIPAGTKGDLIDVIIENGEVRFLLTFEEFDEMDWVDLDELEEKY